MDQLLSTEYIVSILLSGISLGGQLALIAIGYTMVYGILRLINFAHGDMFMVARFIMIYITSWSSGFFGAGSIAVDLILTLILTVVLGVMIEKVAYKPLRSAPRMSVMISAIGVSYLLQNLSTYVTGGLAQAYPNIPWLRTEIQIGGITVRRLAILTPVLTILLVIALVIVIKHTKMGMAMRAVAKDFDTAQLMGIRIDRVISITFVIGSFLAAVGSILYFSYIGQVSPTIGAMPGLKSFVAAVFDVVGDRQHVQTVVPRFAHAELGRAVAVRIDRVGVQVGFVGGVAVHLGQHEFHTLRGDAPGVARDVGIVGVGIVALCAHGACCREGDDEKQRFFHGLVVFGWYKTREVLNEGPLSVIVRCRGITSRIPCRWRGNPRL